jgi:curved DNA-binding protein CbpA
MTRDEALRLLGLDEGASEADIRLAYKEMAQILHPDKFSDNKRLAERATEQFKHVNEARDVLLAGRGRGASRRGARRSASRPTGYPGPSAAYAGAYGSDREAALRARLAGIAAARVQLTAQLDSERDRRRVGLYLTMAGVIGMIAGRVIKPLLAIAPLGAVWGIVQLFSSLANIKTITGHLEELERHRRQCEQELEKL